MLCLLLLRAWSVCVVCQRCCRLTVPARPCPRHLLHARTGSLRPSPRCGRTAATPRSRDCGGNPETPAGTHTYAHGREHIPHVQPACGAVGGERAVASRCPAGPSLLESPE